MITRIEITGVHMKVDEDLDKYATKKFGTLDHYAPRRTRESLRLEVKLKESNAKNKKNCTCEVLLHMPDETITVSESTFNMYAAIDIVETKLKNQLKKYKDTHSRKLIHHRLIRKLQHG